MLEFIIISIVSVGAVSGFVLARLLNPPDLHFQLAGAGISGALFLAGCLWLFPQTLALTLLIVTTFFLWFWAAYRHVLLQIMEQIGLARHAQEAVFNKDIDRLTDEHATRLQRIDESNLPDHLREVFAEQERTRYQNNLGRYLRPNDDDLQNPF